MALSLKKPKLDNLASDIWKSAQRLRGKFKSYEYQSVILPIIVIRRLECVLIAWREQKAAKVLAERPKLAEQALIVKHIELRLQDIGKIRPSLETEIATLTAYRKSLIHECVIGQRRVTESDCRAIQEKTSTAAKSKG